MRLRAPAVAGAFYPEEAAALRRSIKRAYTHKLGPGVEPRPRAEREGRVKGLVVPHAGYPYSGHVAAHAYAALAADGLPDTAIILGPNHHGLGSGVALTTEDHATPVGTVEVNQGLAKALFTGLIDNSPAAHRREHSIEVQLPFLKELNPRLQFVPLDMLMQDRRTSKEVGQTIAEVVAEQGGDILLIASTDMSHYVPASVAQAKDAIALDQIADFNTEGLYEAVAAHSISMCGVGPVAAMLHATAKLGAKQAKLLKYATSGDVTPMAEVVGYAAMVVT